MQAEQVFSSMYIGLDWTGERTGLSTKLSYDLVCRKCNVNMLWRCIFLACRNDDQISTCELYSWSRLVEIL